MLDKSFAFLKPLQQNNNREWYHANKALYQDAKAEFELITEMLISEVSRFDKSITGLAPKDCIFRIFRDVRFSKDKSPYKTNFGTFLAPGGRKSAHAGYYLHIEPGGCFVAAGIYMPPADILRGIRTNIVMHYDEYMEILEDADLKKHFGGVTGEKLKNPPRGFDKDFEGIEQIKFKNYGLTAFRTDAEIQGDDSFGDIVGLFRVASGFVGFLNEGR